MKNIEMDKEALERIADFFDPWDLVDLLGLTTKDIVEAFPEAIEEAIEDIEELMGVRNEDGTD